MKVGDRILSKIHGVGVVAKIAKGQVKIDLEDSPTIEIPMEEALADAKYYINTYPDSDEAQSDKRFHNLLKARELIVDNIKRTAINPGTITCPVCQGILHYAQSSYNGHIHAKCETENCLSWIE